MPKKDKKASKKDKSRDPADVVEAVRGAVERTFQATTGGTEGARDRGRSLLDDVASAAQRIRETFDDLPVVDDIRGLRVEIEALSRRVAELEKKQAAAPAAKPTPAPARRTPAKRGTSAAGAAKPSAARTAAKTTGSKPKPKPKPRPAARRKPATPRSASGGDA